ALRVELPPHFDEPVPRGVEPLKFLPRLPVELSPVRTAFVLLGHPLAGTELRLVRPPRILVDRNCDGWPVVRRAQERVVWRERPVLHRPCPPGELRPHQVAYFPEACLALFRRH